MALGTLVSPRVLGMTVLSGCVCVGRGVVWASGNRMAFTDMVGPFQVKGLDVAICSYFG